MQQKDSIKGSGEALRKHVFTCFLCQRERGGSLLVTCYVAIAEVHHYLIDDASACRSFIMHIKCNLFRTISSRHLRSMLVDGQPRSQLHVRFELLRSERKYSYPLRKSY